MKEKRKYRYLKIAGLVLAILLAGCKRYQSQPDDCSTYTYSDCNTTEPMKGRVNVFFTINSHSPKVAYTLYRGNVEDGIVVFKDTSYDGKLQFDLDFGTYSAKAIYHIDNKEITVIDGGETEKWSNWICDSLCWDYDSLNLDLRLQ